MVNLDLLYKPVANSSERSIGRLVVVSNRVPVPNASGAPAAGGLAVALQAALRSRGGVWFGWSGKSAQDAADRQPQTRSLGPITFAVSDLTRRDIEEYYHGFANRALWPICHYRLDLANISERDAAGYFRVNEFFARRLVKLLRPDDIIWIHDYHMIPLAGFLRELGAANRIGYFHHIPWPSPDTASALPCYDRILESFSAYDVVGFQTVPDADNFRDCLIQSAAGRVGADGVCEAHGRKFLVDAFPISIDPDSFALEARLAERNAVVKRMRVSLEGRAMVIGVDRLDYSKGIKHRLEAFAAFLENNPDAVKARVTMLQITPKSRSEVPEYARIQREVAEEVGHLNGKLGDIDWTPLRYINKPMSQAALAGLYRLARVGLVTPLRDGMNLVAKEYVAAQDPNDPGVLVLSQYAGAAQELKSALIVNPYDIEATAAAIARAVAMPLEERIDRWRDMMSALRGNSIDHWTNKCLQAISGEVEAEGESSLHPAGSIIRSGAIPAAEPWLCAQPSPSAVRH
ncbi:alpha,alpha-trehalose-phosphate synthase (UDP-forming) [Methylocella silvestris BL2]|uniref:Alpha,alpha-trehalose-phosphate synthase (UDP-forming) n=1 Tax=Methylocella silvestris (strain DSM 15510 / CIP 108128 / LMG 27833 / NCIMB 13906 / BL2) TaxID=395965 RepID=B8EMX2_METSB|nr:trehalose-6-phosphate synthase [Methylocella silvestris]ACK52801.1 alpha,alpha-trehalose-phosphate synthase (UDP-forming) [Methylocella silvestris BL2]